MNILFSVYQKWNDSSSMPGYITRQDIQGGRDEQQCPVPAANNFLQES
ncbi:MAG: hypothetical protein WCP19_13535 [Chloroflexota bacterium]